MQGACEEGEQEGDPRASLSTEEAPGVLIELKELLRLAAPACLQLCAQQAMIITNQRFSGQLGKEELAAASIGMSIQNLLWYFLLGSSTAVDSLASQAFGAGNRPAVLGWCISATVAISLMCAPLSMWLVFSKQVATTLFRQPPDIAQMISTYCLWFLPCLWPFVWAIILMKGLQAQNRMWGPAFATLIAAVVNVPLTWLLCNRFSFLGAALANSASRLLQFFAMLGYVLLAKDCFSLIQPCRPMNFQTRQKGSQDAEDETAAVDLDELLLPSAVKKVSMRKVLLAGVSWRQLSGVLALGLPGGVMLAADAGAFEVTTALAGILGTTSVDAHTTVMTLVGSAYVVLPFGIAVAATIRVGNLLGAGRPKQARLAGNLTVWVCMLTMLLSGILFFLLRNVAGNAFVHDKEVAKKVAQIGLIVMGYQVFDGIFAGTSGVLRGMGRQAELMIYCLTGFWGVGIIFGAVLTFWVWHLGIVGLWLGIFAGVLATAALCGASFLRADWEKEADLAQEGAELARQQEQAAEASEAALL